jgi:hypothetical protein
MAKKSPAAGTDFNFGANVFKGTKTTKGKAASPWKRSSTGKARKDFSSGGT